MPQPLLQVLSRWEIDPPVIGAAEAGGELKSLFGTLCDQSILQPITPAGSFTCTECGERRRVTHLPDPSSGGYAYITCPDCGTAEVPHGLLDRWKIDTTALISVVFRDANLSVQERVAGQLWQVGKAKWAGRSRDVYFARCFRNDTASATVEQLKRRPTAIVFAPTETGAGRWQMAAGNLTLALETTLSFEDGSICFDTDHVESCLVDAGLGDTAAAARKPPKRARRTANIERLKKEVIKHLVAARDYALDKQVRNGEPELLVRPSQKVLGEMVGLSESDVTRCMQDEHAQELNLYWNTALDLDAIMRWKGAISKGPKT